MMKDYRFLIVVLAIFTACASQKGIVDIKSQNKTEIPEDSVEYELITFDGRFDTWYMLQNSPALYRSQQYYESWNQRYVAEWNYRAMHPRGNSFFENIINYEPNVDYGFELNHELFYYFQYVEKILNIRILSTGGPVIPLI